jgi:hypothetical protein
MLHRIKNERCNVVTSGITKRVTAEKVRDDDAGITPMDSAKGPKQIPNAAFSYFSHTTGRANNGIGERGEHWCGPEPRALPAAIRHRGDI